MQWKGRRSSDNVEDRRASTGGRIGGGAGSGVGLSILSFVARKFGFKGIIIAVIAVVVLWRLGIVDPSALLGGGTSVTSSNNAEFVETAREKELYQFVTVVLADTERVWAQQFARHGQKYTPPTLVVYRKMTNTGGCGGGSAAMGPFYCPADKKIYIDLSFYDELEKSFKAPGDFAQAYVLAHEVGHHVQNLLGTSQKVSARRNQPDGKQMSVRLELQADFYAGVWANNNREYLEKGDIEEAMRAANAIGDDAIQMKSQGRVVPHAFTHGTSEQRMRWFMAGLKSGKVEEGDTFSGSYESL